MKLDNFCEKETFSVLNIGMRRYTATTPKRSRWHMQQAWASDGGQRGLAPLDFENDILLLHF